MADKVLRFTAEDSGYGQTIDRMAAKLRGAFTNTGMNDILQEADTKFTNFGDKIRYIKEQLATIKTANEGERQETASAAVTENVRTGYKRSNDAVQKEISKAYEKEERAIDRLVEALDRFGEKIEDQEDKQGASGQNRDTEGGIAVLGRSSGGSSLLGGALEVALGLGIAKVGEAFIGALREGFGIIRQENTLAAKATFDPNLRTPDALGVSNKEQLEAMGRVDATRRFRSIGSALSTETTNRTAFTKGYGISEDQFGALDRFYRPGQQYSGGMLDKSGFDSRRTIVEILSRADRQGILGVSKEDFTLLPEKIGQVTGLMQQQYAQGERTNANTAIGLILAGQKIGGRFSDDRAADTFGKVSNAIAHPNSPGSRSFLYEVISRAHPNLTPTRVEARLQNGLSEENIKDIFPLVNRIQSHELRVRAWQTFGLQDDVQSAIRLADSRSVPEIMKQLKNHGLDKTHTDAVQKTAQDRAEKYTQDIDKLEAKFSNAITDFGTYVAKFANAVLSGDTKTLDSLTPKAGGLKVNDLLKSPFGKLAAAGAKKHL